jgi:uncharacterized protein (UPF0548 family)
MPARSTGDPGPRIGPPWLSWGDPAAQLDRIHSLQVNFAAEQLPAARDGAWHVDDYCRPLPAEPRGEPTPDGSFALAKELLRDYEFADPRRIRAYYRADAPLQGRDMLLEIRYLGLRMRVGVRVGVVFDEVRDVDGRRAHIWGWAYRTLDGHLERGQMDYQVWKWLDSGKVEFRIHAVAQVAKTRRPLLNLGFRLVGRRQQVRFARRCAERMERLVAARRRPAPAAEHQGTEREIVVSPTS